MGDHRASIKITFEMHGRESTTDMWINWYPDERGVDARVIKFFQEAADKSMEAWWDEDNRREKARLEKERQEERELYERLKVKFAESEPPK